MITAAFDYQFGALAQRDNELMKAYFGLMYEYLKLQPASVLILCFLRNDTLGQPTKKNHFLANNTACLGFAVKSQVF